MGEKYCVDMEGANININTNGSDSITYLEEPGRSKN